MSERRMWSTCFHEGGHVVAAFELGSGVPDYVSACKQSNGRSGVCWQNFPADFPAEREIITYLAGKLRPHLPLLNQMHSYPSWSKLTPMNLRHWILRKASPRTQTKLQNTSLNDCG
jgi:hypothetical protein